MKSPERHSPELSRVQDLLAAVSTAISDVRCLRGRWSVVSATIDRLRSAADNLAVLPLSVSDHPLVGDLYSSLDEKLGVALSLARACTAAEPPAGKLRTQSDLAAIASSLDRLAADAELLLRSGVFSDPAAASVSGGGREAVRAEARGLVTRLQLSSSSATCGNALDSLLGLLRADDKNALIVAAQGAAPPLVRLLSDPIASTREKAAAAIARLAAVEGCRQALASEGALLTSRLARAVESIAGAGGDSAAENTCSALIPLTLSHDNAAMAGSRGTISALLVLTRGGSGTAQFAAAAVLNNLSVFPDLHHNFLEENSIQILITLLPSVAKQTQEQILGCLRNLASADDFTHTIKLSMVQLGILEIVKDLQTIEPALSLLSCLSKLHYIAELAIALGLASNVARALSSNSASVRIDSARAITSVSINSKVRRDFAELGSIQKLVSMLEAKIVEEKEAAAEALACLIECKDCRRIFKKEEKGIWNVTQLLDPLSKNIDRKYAVAVLLKVKHSRRCRKQMVDAGAAGYLRRMTVDLEVDGAKKLLDCLEKGKIWEVFARR